ncbi:hypothetical protein PMIN03_004161 [Paraphaeosphaeria minitans]
MPGRDAAITARFTTWARYTHKWWFQTLRNNSRSIRFRVFRTWTLTSESSTRVVLPVLTFASGWRVSQLHLYFDNVGQCDGIFSFLLLCIQAGSTVCVRESGTKEHDVTLARLCYGAVEGNAIPNDLCSSNMKAFEESQHESGL